MSNERKKESFEPILFILIAIVLVASNIVAKWEFDFLGIPILWSAPIYSLLFAIIALYAKKYAKNRAIAAVILAPIVQLVVFYVCKMCKLDIFISTNLLYFSLVAFIISQLINIAMTKEKADDEKTIIKYAVTTLIDSVIFLALYAIFSGNYKIAIMSVAMSFVFKYLCVLIYEFLFTNIDNKEYKLK